MPLHDVSSLALEPVDDLRPIQIRADPSGLAFDVHAETLYVADAYSGAIVRVVGPRQRRIATIDGAGVIGADRIAGLAITPYGTLYAARPGGGQAGTIIRVEPDGQTEILDGLPARYTRLGLAYDAREHALYTTQFVASAHGAVDGSVVVIDLVSGVPSTIIDGFTRPVGIAKLGSTLVVADARQRAVFRIDLVAGRAVRRLQIVGDIGRPDSVCAAGPDSVIVTSYDEEAERGAVRRLWLDGRTRGIARGPWEPRGVATDGEHAYVAIRRGGQVLKFTV